MTARTRWRTLAWVCACASAVPALQIAAPNVQSAPTITALACVCAAVVLAAFGWAMRAEGALAPPWHWSVVFGALLLALGVGSAVGLLLPTASPAAVVFVALGFWGYYRWAQWGMPLGFAPRVTVLARSFGLAAALWLPVALGGGAGEVLRLSALSLGAAVFVGIVPLAGGTILWEYVQPVLVAWIRRRSARGRTRAG